MRMKQQAEAESSKAAKDGNGAKHVEFQKSLMLFGKWCDRFKFTSIVLN